MNGTTRSREYLTCAESAAMLRASLKRNFPGVKFSVRSKTYSGGASVRIGWNNGPTTEQVNRVACRFEGADFDGMQDLKTNKTQLLVDERGDVREVIFGSDFIFCDRNVSESIEAGIVAALRENWEPKQRDSYDARPYEWHSRARQAYSRIEIPTGEPEAITIKRAVEAYFA